MTTNEKMIGEFIQSKLMVDKTRTLTDNDGLIETGIIDSLGIFKLINYLETAFSIKIADDDLVSENFETIRAIASFVDGKNSGTPAGR